MKTSAQIVREVKGTLAGERFKLKDNGIEMLHQYASGKISSKELIVELIKKYIRK